MFDIVIVSEPLFITLEKVLESRGINEANVLKKRVLESSGFSIIFFLTKSKIASVYLVEDFRKKEFVQSGFFISLKFSACLFLILKVFNSIFLDPNFNKNFNNSNFKK